MLTKKDLGQIREVVETSEKRVIEKITKTIILAVGEMIDQNILPQFDELHEKFDGLAKDVDILKQDVSVLKQDVSEIKYEHRTANAKMVTKGGLEDRLTDFRLSLSGTIA